MSAAENGHYKFARWLLDRGAAVNQAMETGWTAMHSAAKNDHGRVLVLLLRRGGDKNLKATHRDFGRNLFVEDVTANEDTLAILQKHEKKTNKEDEVIDTTTGTANLQQQQSWYHGHSHGNFPASN